MQISQSQSVQTRFQGTFEVHAKEDGGRWPSVRTVAKELKAIAEEYGVTAAVSRKEDGKQYFVIGEEDESRISPKVRLPKRLVVEVTAPPSPVSTTRIHSADDAVTQLLRGFKFAFSYRPGRPSPKRQKGLEYQVDSTSVSRWDTIRDEAFKLVDKKLARIRGLRRQQRASQNP